MVEENRGSGRSALKVAVSYHLWPHYRKAVMQALDRQTDIHYTFVGSGKQYSGIEHVDTTAVRSFVVASFRAVGPFKWQGGAVKIAFNDYDAFVFLGDPYHLSTWVAAIVARLRGKNVLFWAHGWLRQEGRFKAWFRRAFFSLAHRLLVYSDRGRELGIMAGFSPGRIITVYNSLDVPEADSIYARLRSGELDTIDPRKLFKQSDAPLIICTARLTDKCRFDLLLTALVHLRELGQTINVILVGDGPAKENLIALSKDLELAVHFFGACYDEEIIAQLIYHADITVSPGKVGLTAMHSLMYGTPVISHNDLDNQMPEIAAIEPGVTGELFAFDDAIDLARAIRLWLRTGGDRESVRVAARAEIHAKWHPSVQAQIIASTLKEVARGA